MYIYPINAHVSVRDMKKRIKGTKSVRIIPINARTSSVRDKKKREGKKKRIMKKTPIMQALGKQQNESVVEQTEI